MAQLLCSFLPYLSTLTSPLNSTLVLRKEKNDASVWADNEVAVERHSTETSESYNSARLS